MSFYINKKLNFKTRGLLDIIHEDSIYENSKFKPKIITQLDNLSKENDNDTFSGNIEDLPDSVFLAVGEYLYQQSIKED